MTDEIKTCPFCGSKRRPRVVFEGSWFGMCRDCSSAGPPGHGTIAEAIAAWNRRSTPTTDEIKDAVKRVKELEEALTSWRVRDEHIVLDHVSGGRITLWKGQPMTHLAGTHRALSKTTKALSLLPSASVQLEGDG